MDYKEFVEAKRRIPVEGFEVIDVSRLITAVDQEIKGMGLEEESFLFYPKGIFTNEQLELYFFTATKIVKVNLINKYTYKITTRLLKDVRKIEMVSSLNTSYDKSLSFQLGDDKIHFNSIKDTYGYWIERFAMLIQDIHIYLLKASH